MAIDLPKPLNLTVQKAKGNEMEKNEKTRENSANNLEGSVRTVFKKLDFLLRNNFKTKDKAMNGKSLEDLYEKLRAYSSKHHNHHQNNVLNVYKEENKTKENSPLGHTEPKNLELATKAPSGDALDQYTIGKILGLGSYAVVKLAVNKSNNMKVAIKIYDKSKLADPQRRKNV